MLRRIWAAFRRKRLDRELSEEIELHLAMQADEFRRSGMTPAEARAAARREFGGVAQIEEIHRERRGFPWIESTWKDFRYALRGMRRNPAFTAAAVLSLALGIGANTAVFSMFHAILLRMLPVANPQELVTLYRTGAWGVGFGSYPLYLEVAKRTDLFQGVIGRSGVTKVRFGRQETAQREFVTANYFRVLGVPPAAGRLFTDDDNRTPHAHPVAVLSYDFWRTRLGADPTVLGRSITIDEQQLTVIGVAAPNFRGVEVERRVDLWVPAMMRPGDTTMDPGLHWLWIMARRSPDAPRRQIQAAMDVLLQRYLASTYGRNSSDSFRRVAMSQHIEVREGAIGISLLREQFGRPLQVMMAAVGLVLLVACANVAHLLLARAAARHKETALRISLGATRGRLIRQSLSESVVLAAAGALLGVVFAFWGTHGILGFLPATAGEPLPAVPEPAVLIFTLGLSLLSTVLFGLAPAFRSAKHLVPKTSAIRGALVIAQVTFSSVLIVLAGFFGQSLYGLLGVDLGFRNQNVIQFSLEFPESWKPADRRALRERFLARMEGLPGVSTVSCGFPGPILGGTSSTTIRIPGLEMDGKEPMWIGIQTAAPRYFETIGGAIIAGREFERTDTAAARKVAVVNQSFVRRYLPGGAPVLERVIQIKQDENAYIAGVVADIPHGGLRKKVEPTVYVPVDQQSDGWDPVILVRSQTNPSNLARAIRRELGRLGPEIGFSEPKTIRGVIDESIYRERLLATLGWLFGGLALGLAAVGLYGLVAYAAAQRAREIAIRLALGASSQGVVWIVIRSPLLLITAGLAVGLPGAMVAARQISAVLFGVRPADPVTYAVTACVLFATGLAAAMAPARRAVSLDPNRVLRQD